MINYCVRQIDAKTYSFLKEEAQKREISLNALINSILDKYANTAAVINIDDKYRMFVDDIIKLYQMDREEFEALMKRSVEALSRLEQILEEQSKEETL